MNQWLRRVRGALGMGLAWGAAWSAAGMIVVLGFLLGTGGRPDAPVPLVFGAFGFVAGVTFSTVLGLLGRRRRFDQISVPRFAAWGAAGGFLLSLTFVLGMTLTEGPAFLENLIGLGPIFTLAGAVSAAGSLALARKAKSQEWLGPIEEMRPAGPAVKPEVPVAPKAKLPPPGTG